MIEQTEKIKKFDWDVLIILDACRYDKFRKLHHILADSINNDWMLESVSTGDITYTRKWLYKTWGDKLYPQVNYISANGFINSKNIVLSDKFFKFEPRKAFKHIHDVWDYGYDKETGRVSPETMVYYSKKHIDKNMKNILHFQQPHAPYLFPDGSQGGFRNTDKVRNGEVRNGKSFLRIDFQFVTKFLMNNYIPHTIQWMLCDIFKPLQKFAKRKKYASMWKKWGRKGIIRAYEKNLESALIELVDLVNTFPDLKFIITADHGELLGEGGKYGHGDRPTKELTTVPWMTIYPSKPELTKSEEDKVKERLRALGYLE